MKEYFILIRPYGMLFLGFTPVFGAIANGEFTFTHLLLLLLVGVLAHVFTFVQNDYYDIEIDARSRYVSTRPLVTGDVSKAAAFIMFFSSFLLSTLIVIIYLFSWYSLIVLFLSFLFITLYNKYSKRFYAMEYVLSLGVFTYGVFGALTVSNSISYLVVIVSLVGFMQWLFSVGVSANLKDVEFDVKQGVSTTPTLLGVKTIDKKLVIPIGFWVYAFGIKVIHIFNSFITFSSRLYFNICL